MEKLMRLPAKMRFLWVIRWDRREAREVGQWQCAVTHPNGTTTIVVPSRYGFQPQSEDDVLVNCGDTRVIADERRRSIIAVHMGREITCQTGVTFTKIARWDPESRQYRTQWQRVIAHSDGTKTIIVPREREPAREEEQWTCSDFQTVRWGKGPNGKYRIVSAHLEPFVPMPKREAKPKPLASPRKEKGKGKKRTGKAAARVA